MKKLPKGYSGPTVTLADGRLLFVSWIGDPEQFGPCFFDKDGQKCRFRHPLLPFRDDVNVASADLIAFKNTV